MIAAGTHATERRGAAGPGERLVPVNDAGPDLFGKLLKMTTVVTDQPGCQAETCAIGQRQRVVEIVVAQYL